jgi:S1-C subfamily serine protease
MPDGSSLDGLTAANLSPALADELQTDAVSGIIVLDIQRGRAAARLHLAVGDIIRSIDGMPVSLVSDLQRALVTAAQPVHLDIERKAHRLTLTASPPPPPAPPAPKPAMPPANASQ